MIPDPQPRLRIAIACGGTGGHFFPGAAVAQCLQREGCEVFLFVSTKPVDQEALKSVPAFKAVTLPAAGLTRSRWIAPAFGFVRSCASARSVLGKTPCHAILAMGGFTSAPPVLAGKSRGAAIFLHESNTIPGRANRWLARVADRCFVGFPQTARLLKCRSVMVTGTPVRKGFVPGDASEARLALGFKPEFPLLLVIGGSQGANALNRLVPKAAGELSRIHCALQVLHLTGHAELKEVQRSYAQAGIPAVVLPFLDRMDLALRASSAAVARAGASTLAEFAAAQLPSVLIPLPSSAGNHQFHNASALAGLGAAFLIEQREVTPAGLADNIARLLDDQVLRRRMILALQAFHRPDAAERISGEIISLLAGRQARLGAEATPPADTAPRRCAVA